MRLIQLLRLAAQAEGLRWRRMGRGYATQAALGAAAAVFALLLLLMLQVAGYAALARSGQGPVYAALIVAAVDLVLAGILGFMAARYSGDHVALEAQRVRDEALRQVGDTTARAAMLAPLLRSQSAKKGLIGAAVTAAVVGLITRR